LSTERKRNIWTIPGRLQVNSVTRAHHATYCVLTECNRSRLASLKFLFALILAGTIVSL